MSGPAGQPVQRAQSGFAVVQRAKAAVADWRNDPAYGAGKAWPISAAHRPYNDFPEDKYPDSASVAKFKDFTAGQRQALKDYNKSKNGKLKSDAADDPIQDLTDDTGKDSSVEVDHIIPNSKGGCNHYLNARLISRKLNNSIERIKDTSAMVV